MSFPPLIVAALGLAAVYRYPLVFLGVFVEGPLVMIASGFFYRLGAFDLWPLYLTLVFGDLVADIFWYYLGRYFARPLMQKHGKFLGVSKETFDKMEVIMHKHQTAILLGSKVTIGFGLALATVIVAGATKVPFRKYLVLNALGEMILAAILMTVGYWFGHFYSSIGKGFQEVFLAGGILFFLVLTYGFSRYVRTKTLSS